MTITLKYLPLAALLYLISTAMALPVAEENLDHSIKVITASSARASSMQRSPDPFDKPPKKRIIPASDLPASPADLLRPDRFQFYTFDKTGEVVTKQMTEQEIQSLIAAGGGHLPPMAIEIHEPQKAGEVPTGGMKVSDVVQNVQNVLKSELNKPAPMMSSMPTIPGHANSEWSNILPSILSGDMETVPVQSGESLNPYLPQEDRIPVIVGSPDYGEVNEKPMIQVPVITVEEKPAFKNQSSVIKEEEHHSNHEKLSGPIFQILNTISADQLKNDSMTEDNDQMTGASESINSSNMKPLIISNQSFVMNDSFANENNGHVKENTISIVSETHSTSVKIPGKGEVQIDNDELQATPESFTSTLKPIDEDKFQKIEPMKPVLLNNTFKKPESIESTSTTKAVESTTVKNIIVPPKIVQESINDNNPNVKKNETVHVKIELKEIDKNPMKGENKNTTISEEKIVESSTIENVTVKINRISEATTEQTKNEEIETFAPPKSAESTQTTSSAFTESLEAQKTPTTESILFSSTNKPEEQTKSPTIGQSLTEAVISSTEKSGLITTEIPKEAPLPTELEDSLSSMISQISEAMVKPSLVSPLNDDKSAINSSKEPNVEDPNDGKTSTVKRTTESPLSTNQPTTESLITTTVKNLDEKINNNLKNETKPKDSNEAPIVRIDIMETKPTTEFLPQLNETIEQENYTESPVVRIQLTDAVSTVNQIIESQSNVNYGVTPEIEHLTLPPRGSVNANVIGSGLIAGFTNNNEHNEDDIDDSISIDVAKKGTKPVKDDEQSVTEEPPQRTADFADQIDLLMHKINFDQLPIVHHKRISVNSLKKNETKTKTKVSVSTIHNSKDNKTKNGEKNVEILANANNLFLNTSVIEESNKFDKNRIEANETLEIPVVRIDDNNELSTAQSLIPTRIQLNDLPLVHKFTKPEINKNSLKLKNNITETDKNSVKNEEKIKQSTINNTYQDDPYKKLGETMELSESSNVSQANNSSSKIKDQKKDSSMEKLDVTKLPVSIDQISTQKPESFLESSSTKSAEKTLVTSSPMIMKNPEQEAEPEKWTLIPQQLPHTPPKPNVHPKRPDETIATTETSNYHQQVSLDHLKSVDGLDSSVKNLEPDISYFSNLCNDLAFSFWSATNQGLSSSRSLALSPFGMTSMLAMIFLGARGPTSDQMNNLLKLDDVASFNPHLVFQNVTDSVGLSRKQGIANAAFVRELFADRIKVRKLMPFYKEQAQQFYDGVVAEVNFATISDLVRRRTNLMIRKQTGGRIKDFVRGNTVPLRSPLAALSANVFQTDCNTSYASSDGRDGELYFAVSPAIRQRKLIPVPSTVWRAGIFAGYEPNLDATAIALGGVDKLISTIFVIPGQQGFTAPGDNLELLEERLIRGATHDGAWNKLLKVIIPRPGLELQVPKFSHRSIINATAALKRMGLHDLFEKRANLKGINGFGSDLHLTDVLQMNLFSTCGDENILSGRHHVEVYPATPQRNARSSIEFQKKLYRDKSSEHLLSSRPISKLTEDIDKPRLKLDRPFLYFVRHNPTGLILHMGRFNPRLLP